MNLFSNLSVAMGVGGGTATVGSHRIENAAVAEGLFTEGPFAGCALVAIHATGKLWAVSPEPDVLPHVVCERSGNAIFAGGSRWARERVVNGVRAVETDQGYSERSPLGFGPDGAYAEKDTDNGGLRLDGVLVSSSPFITDVCVLGRGKVVYVDAGEVKAFGLEPPKVLGPAVGWLRGFAVAGVWMLLYVLYESSQTRLILSEFDRPESGHVVATNVNTFRPAAARHRAPNEHLIRVAWSVGQGDQPGDLRVYDAALNDARPIAANPIGSFDHPMFVAPFWARADRPNDDYGWTEVPTNAEVAASLDASRIDFSQEDKYFFAETVEQSRVIRDNRFAGFFASLEGGGDDHDVWAAFNLRYTDMVAESRRRGTPIYFCYDGGKWERPLRDLRPYLDVSGVRVVPTVELYPFKINGVLPTDDEIVAEWERQIQFLQRVHGSEIAFVVSMYAQWFDREGLRPNFPIDLIVRLQARAAALVRKYRPRVVFLFAVGRPGGINSYHARLWPILEAWGASSSSVPVINPGVVMLPVPPSVTIKDYSPKSGRAPLEVRLEAEVEGDVRFLRWEVTSPNGQRHESATNPAADRDHAITFVQPGVYRVWLVGLDEHARPILGVATSRERLVTVASGTSPAETAESLITDIEIRLLRLRQLLRA